MVMTEAEILALYEQAKDPDKMVNILAKMEVKSTDEIREIIQKARTAKKRICMLSGTNSLWHFTGQG